MDMERSRADAAALCGEVQRGSAYGADPTTDVGAAVINAVVMARKAGYIAATTGCSRERAEAAYEAAALAKKQAAALAKKQAAVEAAFREKAGVPANNDATKPIATELNDKVEPRTVEAADKWV